DTVYVKVVAKSEATEIDNDEDEYELYDKEDIELEIGDKLNDDIKWYDVFKEVSVKIDGKWKTIEDDRDLEDYPGVELLLKVYNKSDDEIKASHLNSDGEVYLQLYIKNGTNEIKDTSKTIRVYIPVAEAECTVSIYSSKTSTTSTYLKSTKTFSDFEDALDALMDENELEDAFDVTLGTNYVIRIKFGEDQVLGSSYEFEPDYENPIFIDLNGYELKLPSDWINYDDCEDLVVTITNNNDDEDGSLVYRDKSVTLTVAEGSELEFSEGKIPMDTDAECTVTIYKNSNSTSSSSLLKTKVYETLKEALESLEDQDEALETYDIDEDYEDTFVVRMKLGEDQNLSTFKFAPDYDTTVSIDLNGYTLKLKSEWIDYDDCDDLVVKINNTNKDKKATLTYTDLSNTSISLASTDSALTFEEDKIPGIYKVEVASVTNGKVTMSPNKDTVAHGGTVTFTITPNEGYEISSVKDGTKTISAAASGYTVSSKGVGTYKKENITADVTLTVTFKKASSSSSSGSSSAADWTNPFTDVSKTAQYYNAVAFVCSEGLFNGMTATKFEPTTTMTRAMFVTVLGRLAGVDVAKFSGTSFTDVSRNDQQISWAAPYIEWAVQNGITNGTGNGKFSPNDPITHQQMYLFMYRYAMFIENYSTPLTGVSLSGIRDASEIADWAEEGVKFASKNGILITSGGKLTPTENALRCELAMLLHGFCTKVLNYND
ncbi:MAG: S-layer homology domain-containing protein, partial [Clostridia bacterium]|nr:S-layer homology domain-containing protein [Clostridia bacterium]